MSSQGSNSVRVVSGIAFAPMSGDPLSREISTPSTSSTEFVPEVASRPTGRGALEPTQEPVSTLDCQSEGELEEIVINCGDL